MRVLDESIVAFSMTGLLIREVSFHVDSRDRARHDAHGVAVLQGVEETDVLFFDESHKVLQLVLEI